jgi:pilus assembly protein CpaB
MPRLPRLRSPVHTLRRVAAALLAATALALALRPAPVPAAGPGPALVPVAVAATDLAPGTELTEERLTVARLPGDAVPDGSSASAEPLLGRVLAGSVRAGEPLTDVRLVGPGLTDLLPAGQVAAPVRLADLAVAALVHAGDRVDVLATAPDAGRAEVEAAGALVLAVDRPHDVGAEAGGGLLVIAVDRGTAARLAAAATTSTLTVNLPRP